MKICFIHFEDKGKTEMTREEYKTGMFRASGLPKADTSSTTSPQPSTSVISGTTASSTAPAENKKPMTAISGTKPTGGNLPAPKTSSETSRVNQPASSLAPDKTSTGNQQIVTSSQPATQTKPANPPDTAVGTQATPTKEGNKVIHIKHNKFKPLSKTLSALGERLNTAHAKGELKEGNYALDSDIQNLLKTIGKLKSQVDSLRNDQTQLGSNDALGSNQSGTVSEVPSQSKDTHVSNNQSPSSMASTSQSLHSSEYAGQSQTTTVNETDSRKGVGNSTLSKADLGRQIPLKLRIIHPVANKQQKNATILHLKLSDKIKQAKNKSLGKPLLQNPSIGNIATNSVSQNTTLVQPANPVLSKQTTSIEAPKRLDNFRTASTGSAANQAPIPQRAQQTNLPSSANDAQQNSQTKVPNGDVKVSPSTNIASGGNVKQPQLNTGSKQQDMKNTEAPKNSKATNVASGNTLPQSLNQAQTAITDGHAKQPTNALDNAKQTTSPTVSQTAKTPSRVLTTGGAPVWQPLLDVNPAKANPQTSTIPQQSLTTTQKVKPSPQKTAKQITAPQTNTVSQESMATSQKPSPPKTTVQITVPQTSTVPQESMATLQKQLPSKITLQISPQTGTSTGQAKLPQSNTIMQQPLHQSTTQNTAGQLGSTTPITGASSLTKTPPGQQKAKDFTAIENQLAKIVKTQQQKATEKSTIPG